MVTLEITPAFTVGSQAFATEAEAQKYLQSERRRRQIERLILGLEPNQSSRMHFSDMQWDPRRASERFEMNPGTVLRIAAAALQGRDPQSLGISQSVANALASLLVIEQQEA